MKSDKSIKNKTIPRVKMKNKLHNQRIISNSPNSETDFYKLINELEVHQCELELLNEELIQSKEQAEAAEKKYTELFEFAPTGYIMLSGNGTIEMINHTGAQMLGKEKIKFKELKLSDFITEESLQTFNSFIRKIFSTGIKDSCEIILINAENILLFVNLTGIVINKNKNILLNMFDVTERRQAEKAVFESQRLSLIGEMASAIAHDFNNSLQIVTSNLELALLERDLSVKAIKHLSSIETIISDISARIQLLQRFSGNKQSQSQYLTISLNSLIDEVIIQSTPLWKDEAEKKGLVININTNFSNITDIKGNAGELRSVFYNLIKNSIEAMPDGGNISIGTSELNNKIFITIVDTGKGMNEETKNRVFQPFFTTKGFDIGRGLGMSGSYSILKEHGGYINIKKTEPGKGTEIEVVIPVIKNKPEEKFSLPAKNKTKYSRILWVEDNDAIRNTASDIINVLGINADFVSSGFDAVEYLARHNYDLVITDIGMPGMNGWQLADIVNDKYNGRVKVFIVSGWGSQIEENEIKMHGVSKVLHKPFGISKLKSLLND